MLPLVSHQRPGTTATVALNLIQVLLGLTFLSVVNKAFLLVVRKLLEAFCSSHSLQSAQTIRSRSKRSELRKCVDVQLEGLLLLNLDVTILITGSRIQLIRVGV